MREIVLGHAANFENKTTGITSLARSRKRWLIAFFFSAIMGAAMGLTGMMISALVSFGLFQIGTLLDRVDTVLIATAFPLIVFAAHSLDKAAAAKKAMNAISYREQK